MNSISKITIKKLKSKLLTQSLVTQSLMDLLIEKKIFTRKEILDKIDFNMDLWEEVVAENKERITDADVDALNEILETDVLEESELGEDVFSGLYYGPIGDC